MAEHVTTPVLVIGAYAFLLLLVGLTLAAGGGYLIWLGGSPYYFSKQRPPVCGDRRQRHGRCTYRQVRLRDGLRPADVSARPRPLNARSIILGGLGLLNQSVLILFVGVRSMIGILRDVAR
jgi:hypothetical protein